MRMREAVTPDMSYSTCTGAGGGQHAAIHGNLEPFQGWPQVFWITMFGNPIALFFACSDSFAAALRAIAR